MQALPAFVIFQKLNQTQQGWCRWKAPSEWNINIYFLAKKEEVKL